MKNKKRKAISLVTTFTALFAFAGCKKATTTKPTTKDDTVTTEDKKTSEDITVKEYSISFESNGGTFIPTLVVKEGESINKPLDPSKDGYDFAGWFTDEGLEHEFDFQSALNDNITLYAKWELKDVTITFECNGGSEIAPITQKYNTNIEAPLNPEKEGHTFVGWYSDRNFNTPFEFMKMPAENITLYAKYEIKQYNVSFESFGGTQFDSFMCDYNAYINLGSYYNPAKDGCNFVGWFLDMELTTPLENYRMPAEDIVLYAKYEPKRNSISFISNGGTNVDTIIQDAGTDVTAPADPTRFGYTFKGWFTEPSLINQYTFSTMPNSGIVLYAKWEIINYTVVYHANSGVNPSSNPTTVNVQNNKRAIRLLPASLTNYDFVGWYLTPDFKAGTKIYNDELPALTQEILDEYYVDGVLHLYAKYKLHDYKITYVCYGGINTNPSTANIESEEITLSAPLRDNYEFVGWYLDEDFQQPITAIPAGLDHDLTIYAKFNYEQFVINYINVGDAEGTVNPNPSSYNVDDEITLQNPTKKGYVFKGWYSSNSFTDENKITKINRGTTGAINIYAYFEIITYTITYKDNKNFGNRLTYTVEDDFNLIDGSELGWEFDGWYIGSTKYTKVSKGTIGNLNFTPKYNIITYNITFNTEGGSAVESMTYNVNSNFKLPTSNPDDDTLKFIYWKNGTEVLTEIKPGRTGDLNLTAYYADGKYLVTYLNYDGTELAKIEVGKNDTPVYPYENPTKPYTDLCVYEFDGWDQESDDLGNIIATARYIEKQYLVFTKNSEGTAYTVKAERNVVLPENLILPTEYTEDGVTLPVVGVDERGFQNGVNDIKTQNVKKIVVPEGYTSIGSYGFYNCIALEEITLPKSLTTMGQYVFYYARKLAVVNYNCANLTDLTNAYSLFYQCGQDLEEGTIINIGEDVEKVANYFFFTNNSYTTNQFKVKEINFLGEKCKTIGAYAFARLVGIKEITLPDYIETIGEYAFAYCPNIEKVHLPYSLKTNGHSVLYNDSAIAEIELPYIGVKTDGVLNTNYRYLGNIFYYSSSTYANSSYTPQSLKKITLTNETSIPTYAFYGLAYVEEITINEEITSMGQYVFAYCDRLKTLNYNCKNVSDFNSNGYTFYASSRKTEEGLTVNFGENVEVIPAYFFYQINSLDEAYSAMYKEFVFANNSKLTTIGNYAFFGVRYVSEFTIPDSVTTIGQYAFAYSRFETIRLNNTMESISSPYVFAYMSYLKNIYINKITKDFSSNLFINDNALKNVYYNGTFVDWMNNTYSDNYSNPMYYAKYFYVKIGSTYEKITEIDLSSENLERIKEGVFKGFETVTKIKLPNTVKVFEDYAFSGMYRLNSINMPTSLQTIGSYAFDNCYSIKSLTIPNSCTSIGIYAFNNCANLKTLTLPSGLTQLPNGLFCGCSSMESVTLPEGLTYLPSYIFSGMTSLKSVTLPANLDTIGSYAFSNSGIENITIPKTVDDIGSYAFSNTPNLNKVTFEEGSQLDRIYDGMFSHSGIKEITLPESCYRINSNAFEYAENLESFDFTNIEFIGSYAFQYTNIKNIDLKNVIVIDSQAFYYCQKLEEVIIPETVKYIGSSAFYHTDKLNKVYWNATELPYYFYYYYDRKNPSYYNYYYNSTSGIFDYAGSEGDGVVLNIAANVEVLPYYFFYSNNSYTLKLTEVNFASGSKLKKVTNNNNSGGDWPWNYSYAFGYLNSLSEIDIPGVEEISAYFMYYTKNVDTIKINEGTKLLDAYAFYYMGEVENVYIPNSLERVNSSAFNGTHVTNMYYNGSLDEFEEIRYNNSSENLMNYVTNFYYKVDGEYVLYDESDVIVISDEDIFDNDRVAGKTYTEDNPLHIPSNIKRFKPGAFYNTIFECKDIYFDGTLEDWCKIIFDSSNANPMSYADHFFFKEGNTYVEYTDLVIPTSITKINDYAFYYLRNVETLDLNNVENVGRYAFYNLNITSLDTKKVEVVGPYAFNCLYDLESLTLNSALTKVGEYGFAYNNNVTELTIPANVKKIGQYAFCGLYGLEDLTIEDGVTNIAGYAFAYNRNIKKLTIPGSVKKISNYFFYGMQIEEIILEEGIETIERYGFADVKYYVKKLVIPGTVEVIPEECLYYSSSIEEIVLGEGIKEIQTRAICDCGKLKKINIPESIEIIGNYAFYDSYYVEIDLTNIPYIKSIGEYAFEYCYNLKNVVLPSTLESLGQYAFYYCYSMNSIEIDGQFDEIPNGLCYYCQGLRNVKIADHFTKIKSAAFYYCKSLFSFTVGSNITEIEGGAFYGCEKLFVVYNNSDLVLTIGQGDNGHVAYYAKFILSEGEDYELINKDGFIFEKSDDDYTLITYIGEDTEITLPESFVNLEGETITEFSIKYDAFQYNSKITKVTIPGSYKSIMDSMFYYCKNLETVVIGSGIESIGSYAFYESGLKSIVIPDSVTSMSSDVFNRCRNLTSVTLGSGLSEIPSECFYYCEKLESIVIPNNIQRIGYYAFQYSGIKTIDFGTGVERIGNYAFAYCQNLTSITLPSNITDFGSYLFYYCNNLKSFDIQAEDAVISDEMFSNCYGLEEIVIPDSVKSIGYESFYYCTNLKKVTLGANLKSIGNSAFRSCEQITEVIFNDVLESIGDNAFSYSKFTSIELPNSVKSIGQYAFSNCSLMTSFKLSNQITEIPYGMLEWCSALTDLDLNGAPITTIGSEAFYGLQELENLEIPNTVETIGYSAFNNCIKLNNITIPASVKTIESYAFNACHGFTEIIIPDTVETIYSSAFAYCINVKKITLGKGLKTLKYDAFNNCTKLEEVYYNVEALNEYTSTYGLFIYANSTNPFKLTIGKDVMILPNYIFSGYSSSYSPRFSEIVFEEGSVLEQIGQYAFYYNRGALDIVLPESVTVIGNYAFAYSNIKSIEATSLTAVGSDAFYYAQNLESAKVCGSIATNAFYNCTNLSDLDITGATEINPYAFNGCIKLTEVVIPNTVNKIGSNAFQGCSALEKLTIGNGVETWDYNSNSYYYSPFYNLQNLKEVVFVDGTTEVHNYLFSSCTKLEKVTLPETITTIGSYAFTGCVKLNDVNLPSGLVTIGTYAFYNCNRIDSITIPESVTSIENNAFYGCNSLYSVRNLSSSFTIVKGNSGNGYAGYYAVEVINGTQESTLFVYDDKYVFIKDSGIYYLVKYVGDDDITELTLPVPNSEGFIDPSIDEVIQDYRIRQYAFDGNTTIKKLTIPNGVKIIGNNAFSNMKALEEITIGEDVTTIGANAFSEAYNLKVINYNAKSISSYSVAFYYCGLSGEGITVNIGSNVTALPNSLFYGSGTSNYAKIKTVNFANESSLQTIGSSVFYCCYDLEEIVIPDSVTSINYSAFYNCTSLKNVTLSKNMTVINDSLFYNCNNLQSVVMPTTITSIGGSAFAYCSKLNEITIPDGITSIGRSAFYNCTNLELVNLPTGLTTINYQAFYGCSSLVEIVMPNTVTTLAYSAFYECSKLESVTLSQALTKLNYSTFYNCYKLNNIVIPDAITIIDSSCFYNCTSLENVTLPSLLQTLGQYAFYGCSNLKSIHGYGALKTINANAFYDCSNLESAIFESDELSIDYNAFYNCQKLATFDFDGNVTKLGYYAFYNCRKLTEINLGTGLTSIEYNAFEYSGLETIVIPDTVTAIGSYTFRYCYSLTNVTLSNNITVLNEQLFYNCTSLEELVIPEGVTTINSKAITYLSSLRKLVLPSTLTTLYSHSFDLTNLEEVTLGAYFKDMTFSSEKIRKVYVYNDETAEYLLYDRSFGTLIKNASEIYIASSMTITSYITDNYNTSGTVTVDGITYTKFTRKS